MRLLFLLVLVSAIIAGQKLITHQTKTKPLGNKVSPSITLPQTSASVSPTLSPTSSYSVTQILSVTPTQQSVQPETTTSLIYPNAHQLGSSGTGITLQSTDDPQIITNWYKNTIKTMRMNTTSVIENTVNGEVTNQINASGNGKNIKVQITKSSDEATVTIIVSP